MRYEDMNTIYVDHSIVYSWAIMNTKMNHEGWRISWPDGKLLGSQEGLCSVDFINAFCFK